MARCPCSQESRPASSLNKVLLPHPDGPTTQTNSPPQISRLTRSSACTPSPEIVAYVLETSSNSISARALTAGFGGLLAIFCCKDISASSLDPTASSSLRRLVTRRP